MSDREAGLTLVELLVATAITAVIAPVLVGTLTVGWASTDDTVTRLGANRDRLLTSSLLTRDVQAAVTVATTGTTCLQTGDTLVVRFGWTDTDAAGAAVAKTAAWVLTSTTPKVLERRWCAGGTALTSTATASHDVTAATTACRNTAGGSTSACGTSTRTVAVTVTDAAGATYAATGTRRLP